ncbi:p47 [Carabus blaptoides fortunei]
MSDRDTSLSEFVSITNVDEERARFYLESSAWQLEVALASFYENDGNSETPPEEDPVTAPVEETQSSPIVTVTPKQPKQKSKSNSRITTVHSLNSSSSDEEGQAFYAGGSEHSGQQVLGPPKKKDFVTEMFKSVQEHGAEVVEPQGGEKARAFVGTGYKLGQSSNDTEVVAGASRRHSHAEMVLKLWREGFSINNGELRAYSDPANRELLDYVRRGEIPPELIREAKGSEVHLNMEDHRHEEFSMMKAKLQPFSGKGHTLGSPAPAAIGAPSEQEDDKEANERNAKEILKVDYEQPTTNVQIRLADGSRLLGVFNHGHTVADIRNYIRTARPQYENHEFMLLTTFPNRELTDGCQTLANAGLLNAAIMQRLK